MKQITTTEVVTPSIAKRWLEKNTTNRPLNDRHTKFLAQQMKDDNWQQTGESIKFTVDGDLIDGQHRLSAIVSSNVTVTLTVTRGLQQEVFKYLDTGRNRSSSDSLAIAGVAQYNNMSTMIKYVIYLKAGKIAAAAHHTSGKKITNSEVVDFYEKHKESLQESLNKAVNSKSKILPQSLLAAWHYIFKTKSEADANTFIEKFGSGADLGQKNPIYILRERLMQNKISQLKMVDYTKYALIVKSWNAFRGGKQISRLQFDSTKEEFPKPI